MWLSRGTWWRNGSGIQSLVLTGSAESTARTVKRRSCAPGHHGPAVSVTTRAVWYIESHLSGDLSLDAIADAVGVSRFHVSRAFSVTVGCALTAYVRARRLSEAAATLARGAPDIMTVALDSGYGSHEAFTRAFRQQFFLTPDEWRERAALALTPSVHDIPFQEPIRMTDHPTTTPVAPPRIVRSDALLIFGLGQRHALSNAGIPSQWDRFLPYFGNIPDQVGDLTFGVICNTDDAGSIEYICGVQVREFPRSPGRIQPSAHSTANLRRVRAPRPRIVGGGDVAGDLEPRAVERRSQGHRRSGIRAVRKGVRSANGNGRVRHLGADPSVTNR